MEEKYAPLFEEATPSEPPRKRHGKVGVVLMQSVCCAVLVLLFLLFRLLGGEGYTALKNALYAALENNALMETVSGMFTESPTTETTVVTLPTANE